MELSTHGLAQWQQTRILTIMCWSFRSSASSRCSTPAAGTTGTSRLGGSRARCRHRGSFDARAFYVAHVYIDDDALPTTTSRCDWAAAKGWLVVAEISLEELWRFVDTVRVGQRGYALVFRRTAG